MNRRSFMRWLTGTAAAVALGVLPRAYGVPASGLVGTSALRRISVVIPKPMLGLWPISVVPDVVGPVLLSWSGDGDER